jgi:radical S-adenosyl methionine domain-containing protein 2
MLIETINLHVWARCNLRCTYCYGRFPSRPPHLDASAWCKVIDLLAAEGVRRLTFSGGEPTLHPGFGQMLRHARESGLQTSVVTNGVRLASEHVAVLDVVAVTVDSADHSTLERLGRGVGYLDTALRVADLVHANRRRSRLKVNTVVTQLNAAEDLTALIRRLRPFKWKPLQFVRVVGENDDSAEALAVDDGVFADFVERHAALAPEIWLAPESARTIQTTYVMVDPIGRLFQHSPAGHRVSLPLLDVGLRAALEQVGGYDREAFVARGGHLDVRKLPVFQEGVR